MYCDWWAAQAETYPMLSLATRAIAKTHPTEAACERAFSLLKHAFNRLRSRSRDDIVEHHTYGTSATRQNQEGGRRIWDTLRKIAEN
jgi:hypothetical protein